MLLTFLSDMSWFALNLLTLKVNRATFDAFRRSLKKRPLPSHLVCRERSAAEESLCLCLFATKEQHEGTATPDQPHWLSQIETLDSPEGDSMRRRLRYQNLADANGATVRQQVSLPVLKLCTKGGGFKRLSGQLA